MKHTSWRRMRRCSEDKIYKEVQEETETSSRAPSQTTHTKEATCTRHTL
jgi:hypothetical protein